MQYRYLVTWEIDIYADSPREAAEKAWGHMRAPDSTTNVFNVVNRDGDKTRVDLMEDEEDE
jgi:hypothetical protein